VVDKREVKTHKNATGTIAPAVDRPAGFFVAGRDKFPIVFKSFPAPDLGKTEPNNGVGKTGRAGG
jgi:hypothetical protein